LTVIGRNRVPSAVRAVQPGLTLSGTTSARVLDDGSTRTSRRLESHWPVWAGTVPAPATVPASGPVN
jgi:hypothetical protein